jgi:hypothetical protein
MGSAAAAASADVPEAAADMAVASEGPGAAPFFKLLMVISKVKNWREAADFK